MGSLDVNCWLQGLDRCPCNLCTWDVLAGEDVIMGSEDVIVGCKDLITAHAILAGEDVTMGSKGVIVGCTNSITAPYNPCR
eukprot:1156783-Pelagomonas_calceolata.AAC.1